MQSDANKPGSPQSETPFNPAQLASGQPGCVVSREILKKPAGTVTVFAFAAGQGLSEHTAPFDALAHVLEGQAEIAISGKPFRLSAGEMLRMPAGQPHAVKAVTDFKMLLTMIRG